MTVKLGMRVFWNHGPMPVTTRKTARLAMTVPFGVVMNLGGNGGSGGAVNSVNGQTGDVTLSATDVNADEAGTAQSVSDALQPQITVNTDAVAMLTALLSALQAAKADVTYVNDQIATLVGTDTQTLAAIQAISDALTENEDLLSALDQTVANRVRFDVATQGLTALQKYNARVNIGAEESGTAALLIAQITAASIGAATTAQLATLQANVDTKADATNTLALINAKVSSVLLGAANGVATLGSDGKLTATQVPASSGGGTALTWVDLPVIAANNFASGFADGTNKLQVAKDGNGYIWIRGVIRNTSTGQNTNSVAVLPREYVPRVQNTGFNVTASATIVNLNANLEAASFLSTSVSLTETGLRQLSKTPTTFTSNFVGFIAPQILGVSAA